MKKQTPAQLTKDMRVFRHTEKNRKITVVYKYDRDTNQLTYGASIFRSTDTTQSFCKRTHVGTAVNRFTKRPVMIANFEDKANVADLHKAIRKELYTHGVKGERTHNH